MNRRASHMNMTAAQAAEEAASFRMNKMNQSDLVLGLGSVCALSFFVLKGIIIRLLDLAIILAGLAAGGNRMQMTAA